MSWSKKKKSKPTCPYCGNKRTYYNKHFHTWRCTNCKKSFNIGNSQHAKDIKQPAQIKNFSPKYQRKSKNIRRFLWQPLAYLFGKVWLLIGIAVVIGLPIFLGLSYCAVDLITDELGTEVALYNEVNNYREVEGLFSLIRVDFLDEIAREHSYYMIEHGLSHTGFDSRADIIMSSMSATLVAENCLENDGSYNAHAMAESWYESPGHRDNMLDPAFIRSGIGVAAGRGHVYATQIFTD